MLLPEGRLQRMHFVGRSEPFDRGDRPPLGLNRQDVATLHRVPVEMDGAGAALRGVAADVGAGEVELVPQHVDQEIPGLGVDLPGRSVDLQCDGSLHERPLPVDREWFDVDRTGGLS